MSVPRALRPFAHHNYRVLIAALAISIFGTGMWAVAMVYQVIHLGGGPAELSIVATCSSVWAAANADVTVCRCSTRRRRPTRSPRRPSEE